MLYRGDCLADSAVSTRRNILEAGKREFMDKGFRAASLRSIVKTAGVTTGAFYGYYKSKEDLFDALVSEVYTAMMAHFNQAQNSLPNCRRRNSLTTWGITPGTGWTG